MTIVLHKRPYVKEKLHKKSFLLFEKNKKKHAFCTDMDIMNWLQTALGFACVFSLAILFYADSKEWMIYKSEQKRDSGYLVFDKFEFILLLANSVLVVLSYYATFFFTGERHAWIALTFASSEVLIIIKPRILRWM